MRCVSAAALFVFLAVQQNGLTDESAPITSIRVSADGNTIIATAANSVRALRWSNFEQSAAIRVAFAKIHDVKFSPDESTIYVAGGEPGESGFVASYSWPACEQQWLIQVADDVAYALAVAPDGSQIATAGHDSNVVMLSTENGKVVRTYSRHSKSVLSVLFVDDQTLLSAGRDHSIRVWDLSSGDLTRSLKNHTKPVTEMAVRLSKQSLPMMVSSGEDKTVRFWQPTIGRMVRFKRYRSPVNCVAFTSDGESVLAGCRDGVVRVTNVSTLDTEHLPKVCDGWINCVAVHPNGAEAIAGCSTGEIRKNSLRQN